MLEDATTLSNFFEAGATEADSVREVLGPRIRQARVERLRGSNLKVFGRRVAERMGRNRAFSNVTISNWETGRQEPSFGALMAIASLTHLPLRYFAGVGAMADYPCIDWLAAQREVDSTRLQEALIQSSTLPQPAQQVVAAQLRSLIDDLYRLSGVDQAP